MPNQKRAWVNHHRTSVSLFIHFNVYFMGLNSNDRKTVEKEALYAGFKWNSDNSKMVNKDGDSLKFSQTGQSANLNGNSYNDTSSIKNKLNS